MNLQIVCRTDLHRYICVLFELSSKPFGYIVCDSGVRSYHKQAPSLSVFQLEMKYFHR